MKPNTSPKTPPYMNEVTHITNDIAREKSNWILCYFDIFINYIGLIIDINTAMNHALM